MKTERSTAKSYWVSFGKRVAAQGKTLEWATSMGAPAKNEAIRDLVREGFDAETKRRAA